VSRCGLVNLNKPAGMTSRKALDVVARLVRPAKAGHAGTLDPLASGVLLVCVGAATRLVELLHGLPKCYRATFLLGRTSETLDTDSPVTLLAAPPVPSLDALRLAADRLTGTILQQPPAYSALKVQGQRAYDLARAGRQVELAPRPVTIYRLQITDYAYPRLELDVDCSSGTYVRAVGRDLAAAVGTAAVMSALVRTAIGSFALDHSVDPDALTPDRLEAHLLPAAQGVAHLPPVTLSGEQIERIGHGQAVAGPPGLPAGPLAGLDAGGALVAILRTGPDGRLAPCISFVAR
jgi:tRNA pseudouridine55 synthase